MTDDGLNKYLDVIGREPLLTDEQERQLSVQIQQGDGDAVGYFALCPIVSASVTVDDPLRPYYKKKF